MRDKHVFLIYISSSLLKEILAYAYRLTLMSFFIKVMMGNYEACSIITPDSFFFEAVITEHHFWRYCTILPETNFTFRKSFQVFTSQTNKSVLNWVILILIEQNIISKRWNQDFPPSKTEYVITLPKLSVRLILFLFLVVYRGTFKVVLAIFRISFFKKPF